MSVRRCHHIVSIGVLSAALAVSVCGAETTPVDAASAPVSAAASSYEQQVKPLLNTYCYPCHNTEKTKGDINLSTLDTAQAALRARKTWKAVHAQLVEKEMPPEEAKKQPSEVERAVITAWIAALKASDRPDAGRTTVRRLNRAEYQATILDLIGITYQVGAEFPHDDVSNGFDNIADTLSLSPFLMEKYLMAADAILEQALLSETVIVRRGAGELDAQITGVSHPGQPQAKQRLFNAAGELTGTIAIPAAGDYIIAVRAGADQITGQPARVRVSIDGQLLSDTVVTALTTAPGVITCRARLAAGERKLVIEVLRPTLGATTVSALASQSAHCVVMIENIEVMGPPTAQPSGPAKAILIATLGSGLTKREAARRIAERFASRAYRRPASPDQLALLLTVFELADRQGRDFVRAVKEMLKAALVAPEFLFRIEQEPLADQDGNYAIDDYDLASRLAYFLWSSLPDETLLALAANGTLHEPAVLQGQVRRIIADPKAQRFIDSFAGQWLLLRNVLVEVGRETKKAALSSELRQALFDEGAALFAHILRTGRSVADFIDPGYTFLNELLAKHYGIPDITGGQMRLVQLDDHRRGGVLTLGALMVVNSHPGRTSPTQRGRWVLEEIIGKPPPPPPPDIPQIQFTRQKNPKATERQVLEIHRERPLCASCHKVMDPIGFGLENFDNQGRWRDKINNDAIDASGELPGKKLFNGPAELKHIIAEHTDDLARVLAERVLTYALGRALQYSDDPTVDAIVAKTAANGYRLETIVSETVLSFPFTHRHIARPGTTP